MCIQGTVRLITVYKYEWKDDEMWPASEKRHEKLKTSILFFFKLNHLYLYSGYYYKNM